MTDVNWKPIEALISTLEWGPRKYPKTNIAGPVLVTNGSDIWITTVQKCTNVNDQVYTSWSVHGAMGYECENEFENPTHWAELPPLPKSDAT